MSAKASPRRSRGGGQSCKMSVAILRANRKADGLAMIPSPQSGFILPGKLIPGPAILHRLGVPVKKPKLQRWLCRGIERESPEE